MHMINLVKFCIFWVVIIVQKELLQELKPLCWPPLPLLSQLLVASARMVPWAKAHLNHTAQALIVSTVAGAAYFIVADKTILKTARRNSFNDTQN
ncbi:putative early nodulin 93 ENOD93 protein [Helianthus annuus]|uniref:Early nodulin 93 ENOD93 protein n=1 Tax=Helianthus annuus TaxID=4232 RepID=A0A9K3NMJ9_HELAN|nr:putative early nodulin 93 ENOD93 protein [Helianthus annuus]